jgi:hypothetical protein
MAGVHLENKRVQDQLSLSIDAAGRGNNGTWRVSRSLERLP